MLRPVSMEIVVEEARRKLLNLVKENAGRGKIIIVIFNCSTTLSSVLILSFFYRCTIEAELERPVQIGSMCFNTTDTI